MSESLEVGIAGATTKQLARANLRETRKLAKLIENLTTVIQEGTTAMADLTASVDALQAEVLAVKERVSGAITPLQEALATAQQTIQDERAADATEDADYEAKVAARDEALSNLQTVIDEQSTEIDQATADLKGVGTTSEA